MTAVDIQERKRIEMQCDERHGQYSRRLLRLEKRDAILWGDAATGQGGRLDAMDRKLDDQGADLAAIKKSVNRIDIKLAGLVASLVIVIQLAFRYIPSP